MSEKKSQKIYRIKDMKTGLYYTGGIFPVKKNPDYDPKASKPNVDYYEARRNFHWDGKHPWNRTYKEYWNEVGKIFTNFRGAQQSVSMLSGTSKHLRKDKAKNILFGNQKSNNYHIVECVINDLEVVEDVQEEK